MIRLSIKNDEIINENNKIINLRILQSVIIIYQRRGTNLISGTNNQSIKNSVNLAKFN